MHPTPDADSLTLSESKYILKRVGDNILPCRTPLDTVKGSDNILFHIITNVCDVYQ